MEILSYIFELGIVYIVLSIIWFFVAGLPKLLTGAFSSNSFGSYLFKTIHYYLLAGLTAIHTKIFIEKHLILSEQAPFYIVLGGVVLFLYLAGKTDRAIMSVEVVANNKNIRLGGALTYEPHIVGIAIILYIVSFSYPMLVDNNFMNGLYVNMLDFYHTFIIHFILSIVGFFFLFSMISRGLTATGRLVEVFVHLVTGKPLIERKRKENPFSKFNNFSSNNPFQANDKEEEIDEDEYVDFEEIEDDEKER